MVESGRHGLSLGESVIRLLVLGRRHVPDRLMQPVVVNQSTHSNVAYSTASRVRHGPRVDHHGLDSRRRTKATLIYRRTKNLRAVQLLLGHRKLESTVRYLGVEVEDALEISEQTEV